MNITPSLLSFFRPKNIAVIGASREPVKVGHQIFKNLLKNEKVTTYPVNPSARSILSQPVFDSLLDIQKSIDVAIIAVPAPYVEKVVEECIEKKVKAVVIISAGFAESSPQGRKIQEEMAERLKAKGIALLGPNSLGYIVPGYNLNASFADQVIPAGSLALISQSGAMLTALFTAMESNQVGASFAISLGNKAGLNENDFLEYALNDSATKFVGLYLESFADLPAFFTLCAKISKTKPIILLKGGRTKRGHTASVSHTAALATNDILLQEASKQFGFVLVNTIEEFMRSLFFLEKYKSLPENVMIITNAGGPGVNTTDLVTEQKLPLASWSTNSIGRIQDELPNLYIANPLDVLGDAREDRFGFVISQAQRDPAIDAILCIITQQAVTNIPQIVKKLIEIKGKKPLTVALIGGSSLQKYRDQLQTAGIFVTEYPNEIIDVLSIIYRCVQARYLPTHSSQIEDTKTEEMSTRPLYADSLEQTFYLLSKYDLNVPRFYIPQHQSELSSLRDFPLYAKTANLALMHKKDIGAVFGVVKNQTQAKDAYVAMSRFGNAVLFQKVIVAELELLVGVSRDPQFGWYMAIGLGGSQSNLISDRAYIFLPTTKSMLLEKFKQTKAYQAVLQYAQKTGKDLVDMVVDDMVKLQNIIKDHPEIQELEINPLMVSEKKTWVADIKIKVT